MNTVEGSLKVKVIRDAIGIRYGKDLYYSFGRSSLYHFIYAYKRFILEIAKTLLAFMKPITNLTSTTNLGLYTTHNQHKALLNASRIGLINSPILPLHALSRRGLALRLLVWSAKLVIYPFCFFQSKHRPALYQTCLLGGMLTYMRLYVKKIVDLNVEILCVSNDHAGDIYILTLLIRDKPNLSVDYVQHGAVKAAFPENYFRNIYVYSNKYAEIYRYLARNPESNIVVVPAIVGPAHADLPLIDVLICFSHQFPIVASMALARTLSKINMVTAAARFHPSDRFSKIKLALLRLFYPIQYSDSKVGYATDFERAKWIVCASSSLLPDALDKGFGPRLVWARQLGLKWDYYGIQGKIREVSCAAEVASLITYRNSQ